MFFEQIYQLISTGTDLSINIRRMNDKLNVAVMPRNNSLKGEQQHMVPLVLSGTPDELDREFLQAVMTPVRKALGILTNLEAFEKAAEKTASQAKSAKPAVEKEPKEVREKREKMEKLLKKADDAAAANRFSEAQTWLKQARLLATPDKQKEIDTRMQEILRKANAGSLFDAQETGTGPSAPQPVQSQPLKPQAPMQSRPVNENPIQRTDDGQMPPQVPAGNAPVSPAPVPHPAVQPASPQPEYGWGAPYGQQPQAMPPQGFAPNGQPYPPYGQQPAYPPYPGAYPYMQAQPVAPAQTPPSHATGRTAQLQPRAQEPAVNYSFDKDDEEDRELLREDPYVEYPDFPEENRMKDEAQQELELVCC